MEVLDGSSRDAGGWLRDLCLYLSPGWLLVVLLGGAGIALESDGLACSASVVEFAVITVYGCYGAALRPLLRAVQDGLNVQLPKI